MYRLILITCSLFLLILIGGLKLHWDRKDITKPDWLSSQIYDETINFKTITVIATAYNSTINQCDTTPYIGAWGDKVSNKTIAVSRDLEKILTYKTGVYFYNPITQKWEFRVVEDRMNKKKKGNRIDLWMETYPEAIQWGKRQIKLYY